MSKFVLKAQDLNSYLTESDIKELKKMEALYSRAMDNFSKLDLKPSGEDKKQLEKLIIEQYNEVGALMQEICANEKSINVYSFVTPPEVHGEASRLIAKLRDIRTGHQEFVYYTQRAYELLFNLAFGLSGKSGDKGPKKNHLIIKTPVTDPVRNFAVHKIPNVDRKIENTVMCVMLRGALLPSMIVSKEIQEYSSVGYLTPFALFKIKRDDKKGEADMEYVLDLARSFFKLEELEGKDLVFADPMNATGGSMVTVVRYLKDQGIKPKSVICVNIISALKGALRAARAIEGISINTLWMDPILNKKAYILPGLGDAGDRINGIDEENDPRNMLRLVADYGTNVTDLYRSQLRIIENTILKTS